MDCSASSLFKYGGYLGAQYEIRRYALMIAVWDELFNTDTHTDFAAAGQDGIALVIHCVLHYRRDSTQ